MSGKNATRERLLDATLVTVAEHGVAKASARTIAARAEVNPALIFYHFGSVEDLLGAACRRGAEQRVATHRAALHEVESFSDLVDVARRIHVTEREAGHVAVLGQLLAGTRSHEALAGAISDGLGVWVQEVEAVLHRVFSGTVLSGVVDVPGLAHAMSAAFIGLELYEGAAPRGAERALASLESLAGIIAVIDDLGPLERRVLERRLRSVPRPGPAGPPDPAEGGA
ncbi:TetR/AcrR family transcriptional regulator [Bogoriella caseilytica]|uniref:TetR family transcriptional regulator n=1 Tax=Bogoriella caseilytica TaxID=56055 RepID=A0A3N2BC21_9MICO|nr:TetR/AcrR family transcriptional regulator [Bogoriella caseilytica]ROR72803.1 TetR family transcriptional regulator [Bogoriella caseilytica]